jgi:hypothetical protein
MAIAASISSLDVMIELPGIVYQKMPVVCPVDCKWVLPW